MRAVAIAPRPRRHAQQGSDSPTTGSSLIIPRRKTPDRPECTNDLAQCFGYRIRWITPAIRLSLLTKPMPQGNRPQTVFDNIERPTIAATILANRSAAKPPINRGAYPVAFPQLG